MKGIPPLRPDYRTSVGMTCKILDPRLRGDDNTKLHKII
jgi:hypothetical protein